MHICEFCGIEFEHSLDIISSRFCCNKHRMQWIAKTSIAKRIKDGNFVSPFKTWKNQKHASFGTWKCCHCDFIAETKRKLLEHKHSKHPEFSKLGWNKGLTKETCPNVARNAAAVKAVMNTPESIKKRSEIQKSIWTEERRKLRSEEKKKLYSEHPEKHPNRILANNRKKMSYPEKIAFDWLSSNNIQFEHQKQIGKYFADFFIPSLNSIIEIDGTHWHNKDKDEQRDKDILKQFGIKTIRISTSEKIEDRLSEIFLLRDKVSAT